MNSLGKWEVLLHKINNKFRVNLPKIKFAGSNSVHITEGENFVLYNTNKGLKGKYEDNLFIKLAIQK